MFGKTTHDDLNAKIRKLDSKVSASQSFFGNYQPHQWNEVFDLIKDIQEDFKKGIRYPTKAERDEAWQTFFNLRDDAYRIRQEQYEEKSQQHYKEIGRYLRDAYWNKTEDEIGDVFTLGLMRTTKEQMKWKGQQLREAGSLLSKYKHEMTKDHKAEIHERIVSIRENHDVFWEQQREYQKEKQQIYEQKKQAWEEGQVRRQHAKERIEANIEKNKESLRKAEDALERQKQHRRKLQDDIASAYSDSFRERAEGWLDECNDKISDIEDSIQRLESWIQEGKDKLNSFH
ncbi:MAG: hypothetical protein QOJ02_1991 [Acidobacteriota bacterium]|jgi:hypothetical protein|nr:hypothetical protein [Acidobacteriota bacterium]